MSISPHPTKLVLISTVLDLLNEYQPNELTIEQVLKASGISSGSLYHHFKDFPTLLDHALTERYAEFGDLQIAGLTDCVLNAKDLNDFEFRLYSLIEQTHSVEVAQVRLMRAWVLSQAAVRPEFKELLSVEQNRVTDGMTDIVREVQNRGWLKPDLDPRVVATFVQSYSVGRIVDDVADPSVDNQNWIYFIQQMVSSSMLNRKK